MAASTAFAEGYQVNLLSTRQAGMGHTGAALKLGAESMHFNPAGLASLQSNVDVSAGLSGVFSYAKATHDGSEYETNNPMSTPVYAYAGFKIYPCLSAGISLTTPFGSTMDWGKNWAGAHLVQKISLKSYNVQPTVAYKPFDKLSIGVGAMVFFGDFSLSRALIAAGDLNGYSAISAFSAMAPQLINPMLDIISMYEDVPAVSATLSGTAQTAAGINIGAQYDVTDKITIGVSYRSKVVMKVKEGNAELTYNSEESFNALKNGITQLNAMAGGLLPELAVPPITEGTFRAELPLPSNLNVGVAYRGAKWTVTAECQFVGWEAYDKLEMNFNQKALQKYNQKAVKNYKNTIIARLGGEYKTTDRLDLRLGAYFDQTPVRDNFFNPETPSMNKVGFSCGASFRPVDRLSIDLAFTYTTGFGRDGSYTDRNLQGAERTFKCSVDAHAASPSIGIRYTL